MLGFCVMKHVLIIVQVSIVGLGHVRYKFYETPFVECVTSWIFVTSTQIFSTGYPHDATEATDHKPYSLLSIHPFDPLSIFYNENTTEQFKTMSVSPDPKIIDLINEKKSNGILKSLEYFPPRTDSGVKVRQQQQHLLSTIDVLTRYLRFDTITSNIKKNFDKKHN